MFCPKCRKALFDEEHCRFCGWTKIEPPRPVPLNRAPQQAQQAAEMPASYYVDSWILFALCMVYGVVRAALGAVNGDGTNLYKGIVACAAACVFIPAIKVMNNATGTLLIKLVVAIAAIILI